LLLLWLLFLLLLLASSRKTEVLNWHVSRVWLSLAYGDAAVSNGRRHGTGACCASGIWLPLVA